jgi:hypothetical protein
MPQRIEKKFGDTEYWSKGMFPIKFQTKAETLAFKTAFEELDDL